MIWKITARKVCLILAVLLVISVVASGCGHSAYYVKPPKGSPSCGALTLDQLELVDGQLKTFTEWYNKIDPSKPQNYKSFGQSLEVTGSYYTSLGKQLQNVADVKSSETEALMTAMAPFGKVYQMLAYDIEDSVEFTIDTNNNTAIEGDNETFMIPEQSWQETHDTLTKAIDYFYK